MRIRQIKPQFWENEKLGGLSRDARLLAIGLISYSDDEGYFNANERLIMTRLFPFEEETLNIGEMLAGLEGIDYVRFHAGQDGRTYGQIVNWQRHQKTNRPNPSKIRELCGITESSLNSYDDSVNDHGVLPIGKGIRKGKGNSTGRKAEPSCESLDSFPQEVQDLVQLFVDTVPQKVTPNLQDGWAKIINDCIRLDNRPISELRQVIMFGRQDEFWESRFRSPKRLRRKNGDGQYYYDVFLEQMGRNQQQKKGPPLNGIDQYLAESRGL